MVKVMAIYDVVSVTLSSAPLCHVSHARELAVASTLERFQKRTGDGREKSRTS